MLMLCIRIIAPLNNFVRCYQQHHHHHLLHNRSVNDFVSIAAADQHKSEYDGDDVYLLFIECVHIINIKKKKDLRINLI